MEVNNMAQILVKRIQHFAQNNEKKCCNDCCNRVAIHVELCNILKLMLHEIFFEIFVHLISHLSSSVRISFHQLSSHQNVIVSK